MDAKRVAIFLPSLRGGGAERMMVNLSGEFAERGLSVDLVLQRAEGPYLSQVPDNVRIIDLRASRMAIALLPLASYLRRERPQSLLSAMMHTNIVAVLAKKLARADMRVVVSERTMLGVSSHKAVSVRGQCLPLLARRIYPWGDGIVAVSEGVADDLVRTLRIPRHRIQVIYNPVVTPDLLEKAGESLEHPWFKPNEPPVILGVGRLEKPKDFPTLLRSFALVRRELACRLVILGEGGERSRLEALTQELGIGEDVDMPGFVDNPFKYMSRAAVFVLSSAWEGFGSVIVEALAVGTPVVCTECPSGPSEILEDGRWGKLVPVGDEKAMAKAILEVLNGMSIDHETRTRAQAFSSDRIAAAYLETLGVRP